jgi:hypothetical protein
MNDAIEVGALTGFHLNSDTAFRICWPSSALVGRPANGLYPLVEATRDDSSLGRRTGRRSLSCVL